MTNVQRKYFTNEGISLSYLDNEQDSQDIPIVLLHGFTASAEINWLDSGWIAILTAAGRRVIAIDARGHGESEKIYDIDYYGAHTMTSDSIVLLKQLGIERADFAGFSMGARMSAFIAIKYPHVVRKLMIGGLGMGLKTGIGDPQPIAEAFRAEDPAGITNRSARRFRRIAEKCGNDLEALACCIMSSRHPITDDLLEHITAKTLIIIGDQDTTGGDPFELQPLIKQSEVLSIIGCNHFNALMHEGFRQAGTDFLVSA